ncbi:zinc protease [Desulfobaculum xiamenense]|uniref:Zinc protease n=1 Tax=Desulfobaculum xiamenense TaxID=995050 RepID=A0A846QEG3_9BACT|nr:M16 family metallopeptidase [Desulfobaculum xiamenense]NJB66671.1 zinc protease [Desulfobaculum xiamenense]
MLHSPTLRAGLRRTSGLRLACAALVAMLTVAALQSHALAAEAPWLDGRWPHEKCDLAPHPDAVFGRLDNGFRYVLLRHDTPKGRTAMHLDVQAGSLMERDNEAGIAHFMEHMVFNGSRHYAPGELIKYFQQNGMSFGGDTNAHTALTETVFKLDLPESSDESITMGLSVLSDFATGALILEEEVNRERGVVLEEKTARDTARSRARQRELDDVFASTRFVNPVIGREDVLIPANAALLRGFYDAWYRPELTILVVVGDFDPKAVEPMVRWAFADFRPRAPRRNVPAWGELAFTGTRAYHDAKTGTTPMVTVEALHQRQHEEDNRALQRRMLAEQLGMKILRERLLTLASRPDAPCSKAFAHMSDSFGLFRQAGMMALCRDGRWNESLTLLENELRRILDHGITQAEFDRAKAFYATSIRRNIKREAATPSRDIAAEIVICLNDDRVYQSARQSLELYGPMLQSMTRSEAEDALREAWNTKRRVISVTGIEIDGLGAGQTPHKAILAAWDAAGTKTVTEWTQDREIRFPYLPVPAKPATVVSREHENSLPAPYDYDRARLDNGVTLLMKTSDAEPDSVEISLCFGTGTARMSEREQRVARLATEVLSMSGAGRLTRMELVQALGGRNIRTDWQARTDCMSISASCLKEDVETALHILRAMLLDQKISEADFAAAMAKLENENERVTGTASGVLGRGGMRFLTGGMGHLSPLALDDVRDITLAELRDFLRRQTALGPVTISATGDFAPDAFVTQAAQLFAGPARPASEATPGVVLTFPAGQTAQQSLEGVLDQAGVLVAYPLPGAITGPMGTDDPQVRDEIRYMLLSRVLGDRLRVRVREELGASYSPSSSTRQYADFPGYGLLVATVATDGGQLDLVQREVEKVFADLAKDGVNAEELERARRQLIAGRAKALRRNMYWRMLLEQEHHSRPGIIARMAATDDVLRATTAAELSELARRTFVTDRAAVFTATPAASESN